MDILAKTIHSLFPLVSMVLLFIGIKRKAITYVISALWLSLITVYIQFESAGWQILGSYFNYQNAFNYSLNLLILLIALIKVVNHLTIDNALFKYASSLFNSFILISCLIVITNLWVNAYFLQNRLEGTPVMQVALMKKPSYCNYRYVFYKVAQDGSVHYLCPDHYGFIPSLGTLTASPDFIAHQLSPSSPPKGQIKQQAKLY